MTRRLSPRYVIWGASFAAMIVMTLLMLTVRDALDKVHIALLYLIVVLLGSANGGRILGLTLAGLAFLAFDVYFLPPYGTLVIENPLDWLVLLTFLVTSVIAAQLLKRSQDDADSARARTAEIERLSALGSEALSVVHAKDALYAIANVIRTTVEIDQCDVYVRYAPDVEPTLAAHTGTTVVDVAPLRNVPRSEQQAGHSLLVWVSEHGVAAAERMDNTVHVPAPTGTDLTDADSRTVLWSDFTGMRVLTVPLRVRNRTVGVLRMANATGLQLVPQQQLFLDALMYYAALAVERVRLTAEAEYVETMREADRLKNALLAAVSHDLRTPLTTIKALAHEVAEQGAKVDDTRILSIEEEADRLTLFVTDLLDLSRLTGGALRLNVAPNTAEDVVGAAVARVGGALGQHTLDIVHDPDAPILVGSFDFVHTLRALVNLIENAAKYSPAGSAIELRVHHDDQRVIFSVADRGPGVPAAEQEQIFEPFYRPPNIPPDVRGAGLGLAIARGLAEAQGGAVRYEPREGGGSVFHLTLPIVENATEILSKF